MAINWSMIVVRPIISDPMTRADRNCTTNCGSLPGCT